jgi:hypothetical protein
MKKCLLLVFLFSFTLAHHGNAETKWTGSSAWRHVIQYKDDGLNATNAAGKDTSKQTTKTHQIRADLNAATKGEVWDWGVGLRTYSSATSEWLTLQDNLDVTVRLENAYFRWNKSFWESDLSVTAGRAKTILLYDSTGQALFDKDNRFDGFGWAWRKANFGLNLTQYVLGSRNQGAVDSSTYSETDATEGSASQQGNFAVLYSFQPHIKFSVAEEVEAVFAAAYHVWSGTSARYTNPVHGGNANSMAGTAVGNVNPIIMDNARQWHLYTNWSLPYSLSFIGEYVQNKKVLYGTRTAPTDKTAQTGALALSLMYGKAKKANDFSLSYSYVRKGIASTINTFSNGNMPADNIGHLIDAKYAVADGLVVNAKAEFYTEKAKVAGDGVAVPAPTQNRLQTQERYEIVSSLAF